MLDKDASSKIYLRSLYKECGGFMIQYFVKLTCDVSLVCRLEHSFLGVPFYPVYFPRIVNLVITGFFFLFIAKVANELALSVLAKLSILYVLASGRPC